MNRNKTDPNADSKDLIRGTTFLFIQDKNANGFYYKKVAISSRKICSVEFPNIVGIQTIQLQKTNKHFRGHCCMVKIDEKWLLFFVWKWTVENMESMIGYFYNGRIPYKEEIAELYISKTISEFHWVNLCEDMFPSNTLPELEYSTSKNDGFIYGNHTPSKIRLPNPFEKLSHKLIGVNGIMNNKKQKNKKCLS